MALQVLCMGSANVDMVASVERNPRTDEKVKVREVSQHFGGSAANTATCLARLGVRTGLVARVGEDPSGDAIVADLRREGVDTRHVLRSPGMSGYTFIGREPDGSRVIYDFKGANSLLRPSDVPPAAAEAEVVFVAGIDEAGVAFAREAFRRARRSVFAPSAYMVQAGIEPLLESCDLLVVNAHEWGLVRKVMPGFSGDSVVTDGRRGATAHVGGREEHVDAFQSTPVDTTGAGDSFCGGLLLGTVRGLPMRERLRLGCAVAALKVRGYGARGGLPRADELERFLREHP